MRQRDGSPRRLTFDEIWLPPKELGNNVPYIKHTDDENFVAPVYFHYTGLEAEPRGEFPANVQHYKTYSIYYSQGVCSMLQRCLPLCLINPCIIDHLDSQLRRHPLSRPRRTRRRHSPVRGTDVANTWDGRRLGDNELSPLSTIRILRWAPVRAPKTSHSAARAELGEADLTR